MSTEPSRLLLALRVAAASALGSLAAVIVVVAQRTITQPTIVDVAVVVVAALCVVAVAMVTSDLERESAATPAFSAADEPSRPPVPAAPDPSPSRPGFTLTGGATAGGTTGGLPWHEAARRGVAGTTRDPAPVPAPAVGPPEQQVIRVGEVDRDRAVRRIVQCPRCGSFAINAQQVRDGCAFECQDCGHPWHWRPGAPWPPTVIRPRLRRLDPSAPSAAPAVWRMPS